MDQTVPCTGVCDSELPEVNFSFCDPDFRLSELIAMAVGKSDAADFADFGSAVEWAGRISQADPGDKIRLLTIRGNKPATTKTTVTLTRKRTRTTNRRHIVNIVIDEVNDENYDFVRTTQCNGGLQVKAWFINDGGNDLIGGNPGISGALFLEPIYDEGDNAIVRFAGTFEWDGEQDPPRTANPIAGFEGAGVSS